MQSSRSFQSLDAANAAPLLQALGGVPKQAMTRRFYLAIAKRYYSRSNTILRLLALFAIGGFALILAATVLLGFPGPITPLVVLGKLWFSGCILLAVIYMAAEMFPPPQEKRSFSARQDWGVVVLNFMLLAGVLAWFME